MFDVDAEMAATGLAIAKLMQGSPESGIDVAAITAGVGLPIGIVLLSVQALVRAGVVLHDGGIFRWAVPLPESSTVARSTKGRKSRGTSPGPKSSPLSVGRCSVCSARVLTGYHGGWEYSLDADPLTETGEAATLAEGVSTFAITTADRWKRRGDVWSQRAPFPTGLRPSVHRAHRCDAAPIIGDHRRSIPGAADLDKIRPPSKDIGEPPF